MTAGDELRVVVFDDVVAARGEQFRIPGLTVLVHGHADAAVTICLPDNRPPPDIVFMDYAMGRGRKSGAEATRDLRAAGFTGDIVAISSDPAANAEMEQAGATRSLPKKAHMRSYMVHLGRTHMRSRAGSV
jgi:DNA-binding NarL/FixJ family response regulator